MNFPRRRPTVRTRLTLVYGTLFLLAGVVLVIVLYLLIERTYPGGRQGAGPNQRSAVSDALSVKTHTELLRRALLDQRSAALAAVLQDSIVTVGSVVLVAVVLGWVLAGRVLRPLRQVTDTAKRVAERNLHERIALRGPQDELKDLADTFDAMLERLDRAFDLQSTFVANASHELRTPLAVSRTLLENALQDHDADVHQRKLHSTLLTMNLRTERTLEGLLALARSQTRTVPRQPVDLSDCAAGALEQIAYEASERGIDLRGTPGPAPLLGDRVLLERLVLNLVQNGVRHNRAGGWVEVVTRSLDPARRVELIVTNTGPAVAAAAVDRIFEPFQRLDDDADGDPGGVGLGLSIVLSIAGMHGGEVRALPRAGGGLVVRVSLPATPAIDGDIAG